MTTVNARDPAYAGGVRADNSDDTAAINAVLAAAGANGADVAWPAGRILTTGGHVIPVGVSARGVRRGISGDGTANGTSFRHRGTGPCFTLKDETSGGAGCGLYDVSIYGSSASDTAVAGAIGVEIGNGQRCNLERVWITGFTNTGVGLRFHNTLGTNLYCEHHHVRNVNVVNCAKCIQFLADGGGSGTSFGYNQHFDVEVQPYANQIGYEISAGATFYNSRIFGQIHYSGNNAIGINVLAGGAVWQGSYIDITGELLGAYTGCIRIKNRGDFRAQGRFYVANSGSTNLADDIAGAASHSFMEPYYDSLLTPHPFLKGTATWNPVGTADGAISDIKSVTVTGAAPGDIPVVGFSTALSDGVSLFASITGADVVKVWFLNKAGFAVDPGLGTLTVNVWKAAG